MIGATSQVVRSSRAWVSWVRRMLAVVGMEGGGVGAIVGGVVDGWGILLLLLLLMLLLLLKEEVGGVVW